MVTVCIGFKYNYLLKNVKIYVYQIEIGGMGY